MADTQEESVIEAPQLEFARGTFDRLQEAEETIKRINNRNEALAYITGVVQTLREMTNSLLLPDSANQLIRYIDEQELHLTELANRIPL